jgi:hypothetical protein
MSSVDKIYIGVALAMAILALKNPRGLIWIAGLAASYFISGAYWRSGGGEPELVAGLCDASLVVAVIVFHKRLWEMWFALIIVMCGIVNFVYLATNLFADIPMAFNAYCYTLEVLNALALFLIGGVSAFMWRGYTDVIAFGPRLHIFDFARIGYRADR